jgi:hypothetical protein
MFRAGAAALRCGVALRVFAVLRCCAVLLVAVFRVAVFLVLVTLRCGVALRVLAALRFGVCVVLFFFASTLRCRRLFLN